MVFNETGENRFFCPNQVLNPCLLMFSMHVSDSICTVVMHDINLEVRASSFLHRSGACSDSFSFYESSVMGMDDAAD
jgi:hypothetical protein